ncbi:CHAD domain-containing protein [Robbsia sp. KACC 23696]|uniref:CHAD domain-containing protein n=1 Tax=Robbsia sp. KACC 23696 TaxID=3149231 RepID=UPI00325B0B78
MQEGPEGDKVPNGTRAEHRNGAAIDRNIAATYDTALAEYDYLARPLWDTVRDRVAECRRLRGDTDPEVIHALRVTLRRLKALQWVYRPRLPATQGDAERDATRILRRAAGSVRDWDVALALAEHWLPRAQKTRTVLTTVRADAAVFGVSRLAEHVAQLSEMPSVAAEAVTSHVPEAMASAVSVDLDFLAARLKTAQKQLRKRGKRAARKGAEAYAALHEVRKAGKRVRDVHALMVGFTHSQVTRAASTHRAWKRARKMDRWASRLLGKDQRKRLQRVQSRFGALNDVVHSATLLQDTAERSRRFAQTRGVRRLIRTLDQVAEGYRRRAIALL